jgi:hypothetical protein
MLERSLSYAFRDLFTYILIAAVITIPLHFLYAFAFKDVIAVTEVHAEIEAFTGERTTRGVGPGDLDTERLAWIGVAALELLLLPLAVRATRRALRADTEDELPTALGAWKGAASERGGFGAALSRNLGPLALAAVLALLTGFLAERAGMLLAELLSDSSTWIGVAAAQGIGRAIGAPLFLVPWAFASLEHQRAKAKEPFAPKLY